MKKKYFYIFLLFSIFSSFCVLAQEDKHNFKLQETNIIEGLNVYPNPVTNGKVNITSKNDSNKSITIFDVLRKKVLQTVLSSKELNVSSLPPGV